MKQVFVLTLTAAMALSLAACGSHDVANNASSDTVLANEDFAANDTLGNDTFGNDAAPIDANATDLNAASVDGNAL